jgi:hypothetical protein
MTRIDKFHALPIGQQLNALSRLTEPLNRCKYCAYLGESCPYNGDNKVCHDGHSLWWLENYTETDF